jgi:hypothetical protein
VGSGGEGVLQDGKLRLRDLLDLGGGKKAYFGEVADSFYISRLRNSELPESINKKRLAIKLTDFDALSPHLGDYLMDILDAYQWAFTEEALALLPERETIHDSIKRIPIANRYLERIVIHRPSWNELPPDDRIALLIHEAVYALLRPECGLGSENVCVQSAKRARDIVAFGFISPPRPLSTAMLNDLLLPRDIGSCPHRKVNLEINFWRTSGKRFVMLAQSRLQTPLETQERESLVKRKCGESIKLAGNDPGLRLEIRAHRKPYVIRPMFYTTPEGSRQMAQAIYPRTAGFSRFIYPTTSCEASVLLLLNDWFLGAISNHIEKPPYCD